MQHLKTLSILNCLNQLTKQYVYKWINEQVVLQLLHPLFINISLLEGKSRGFAYLHFTEKSDAEAALAELYVIATIIFRRFHTK